MIPRMFSTWIEDLGDSKTIAQFLLAKSREEEGKPIWHLELGEPDISSPNSVKQALIEALENDFTQYTVTRGIPQLRKGIADYFSSIYNAPKINPSEEIVVVPGSKFGLYASIMSFVNPGDEVIIAPVPIWSTYGDLVKHFKGKPIFIPGGLDKGIDLNAIEKAITPKTKLLIINSPNNPSSLDYSLAYKGIAEILEKHPTINCISDEIYSELAYSGTTPTILKYTNVRDQIILVSGFSKAWSMTGYRLGYVIAPADITKKIAQIQSNITTCATSFVQSAGIAALKDRAHVEYARKIYTERSKLVMDLLSEIPEISVKSPKAAFYAFPRIAGAKDDFAEKLLDKTGVSITKGSVFNAPTVEYVRISFSAKNEVIEAGLHKLKEFIRMEL